MLRNRLDERTADLLGNVGFRRLYAGHAVSEAGDELYFVAAMWLVYSLSGSTALTGVAGFLARAPGALGFLFGPLVAYWFLVPTLREFPAIDALERNAFAV